MVPRRDSNSHAARTLEPKSSMSTNSTLGSVSYLNCETLSGTIKVSALDGLKVSVAHNAANR